MFLCRKYRRLKLFLLQHIWLTIFLLFFLLIYALLNIKIIIYYLYILTLDVQPYRNAVTLWSSDYHISPIHDLKHRLSSLGVKFFDKSLSHSCSLTGTCWSPLRILKQHNGMIPFDNLSSKFYEFYHDQTEINLVDAFICFHPVAMCELYMPFNRSLIIISSTRYELSRFEPKQWEKLNENLINIAQDSKNLIAANNLYDAEYIRYFTGINVTVLTSFCNYTHTNYNPQRNEFLLAPIHDGNFEKIFDKMLRESLNKSNTNQIKIFSLRSIYPNYHYSDLTHHPAIIYVPYQVSVMSLFEQYRMNIPLVFPSLDLLTEWHYQYGVVNEKTWTQTLAGIQPSSSTIRGVLKDVPDPNNDRDRTAIRYWLKFADFYQWPHIIYYESTDDLLVKLNTTDFLMISQKMKEYNKQLGKNLTEKWNQILDNIKKNSKKFRQINT